VKVTYRHAAQTDVTRQFRYYLVDLDLPHIAVRFKEAVKRTVKEISKHPRIAPPCRLRNSELQNLRSWPLDRRSACIFWWRRTPCGSSGSFTASGT
jgi:plasmid stabilization system protein ParE